MWAWVSRWHSRAPICSSVQSGLSLALLESYCGLEWQLKCPGFSQMFSPLAVFPSALLLFICYYCLVTKSCLTLCDPMDCSPPGSSVHEISQARMLEWVAIPSSRGSSQPRDRIHISCIGGRVLCSWASREAPLPIYLAAHGLSCGMRDLIPWPGIEPRSPVLGMWRLSHWTTREVPALFL